MVKDLSSACDGGEDLDLTINRIRYVEEGFEEGSEKSQKKH